MVMQPEERGLDQALYGYNRGHRRLASSQPLSQLDERYLVRMTDLAGSRILPGYETYLSGYPLPSRDKYVLARTWYAPECERPGCVWTHVLFLTDRDWELNSPENVLAMFKRPSERKPDVDCYGTPVGSVPDGLSKSSKLPGRALIETVEFGLYSADLPIVIVSEASRYELDLLALRLLWQRPLSLRCSFVFCTGALTFLEDRENPYRLQVMAPRVARTVSHGVVIDVDNPAPQEGAVMPRWVQILAQDAIEPTRAWADLVSEADREIEGFPSERTFRDFATSVAGLEDFMSGSLSAQDFLHELISAYPNSGQGRFLKKLAIEQIAEQREWAPLFEGLLNDKAAFALSEMKKELSAAAEEFAVGDVRALLRVADQYLGLRQLTLPQEHVLLVLLDNLNPSSLKNFRPINPQLLLMLAGRQPVIVREPDFWLLQADLDESLDLAEKLSESLGAIELTGGLLLADRFDLLLRVLRMNGKDGAVTAFRLLRSLELGKSGVANRLDGLRDEVAAYPFHVFETFRSSRELITPSQLYVLSTTSLEPWQVLQVCSDPTVWRLALESITTGYSRLHVLAFYFACGNEMGDAGSLMKESFARIHMSAASKDLRGEDWSLIKGRLPDLHFWEKWDRCERIRRGFIVSFVRYGWPISLFEAAVDPYGLRGLLIGSSYAVPEGHALRQQLGFV